MRFFALLSLVVSVPAIQTWADDVPRFGVFEKGFSHGGTYDNPYQDLTAVATLRRPDGREWTMPLFWDGKAVWTLRVSPDLVGEWSYSIRSSDGSLNAQTGSFRCVASNRHGSIQPMHDHPLHFEYQDGTPFWFFGEKAWRVLQTDRAEELDHTSAMHHVDVRAAQGFNYLHTELAGTGGLTSGGNEGGEMFLDAGQEVINPAFFQEVDRRLRHINEKGLICGLVLLYAKGEPSWKSLPDDEARLRFARYVAARYAAFDIVFLVTGEWHFMAKQPDLFRAIGREIRKTDPQGRMIGIHPGPETYGTSSQEFAKDDWMSFGEYAQAYFAPHDREATDANRDDLHRFILDARRHNKPVVDAEYAYYLRDQNYDGAVDKPHSHSRDSFRRASWAIVMGGGYFVTGFGTTYFGGRREVGPFLVDNPRHTEAVSDLDHLHKFFTSLPWWRLEPHDELVKADGGYAYCLADPGKTYVIYAAAGGTFAVRLAPGSYTAVRYNPRTGEEKPLAVGANNYSPVRGGGPCSFTLPDTQDWVVHLKEGTAGSFQGVREPDPRGMGVPPMQHRRDADATEPHRQEAHTALPSSHRIEQITTGPRHHFYGYQGHAGNTPFNAGGTHLVLLETAFQDRLVEKTDAADIVLVDLATKDKTTLTQTRAWNFQQGTMMYWNPLAPDDEIIFNDRDPGTDKVKTVLFNVKTKRRVKEWFFPDAPFGNSGVAQTGGKFLGINYGRLHRLRRITGYAGAHDWTVGVKCPANDGIWLVDTATGAERLLLSFEQLRDLFVAQTPDVAKYDLFINHTLWNRDDTRFLAAVRWFDAKHTLKSIWFTCGSDGTDVVPFTTDPGHPDWDAGTNLMTGRGVVYETRSNSPVETLDKAFFTYDGDLSISRDLNWLASNDFKSNPDKKIQDVRVLIYSRAAHAGLRLPWYSRGVYFWNNKEDYRDDNRIDVSPCWNRDATKIYFVALADDGTRQAFVVHLSWESPTP